MGLFWNRQPDPPASPALTARLADAEAEIAGLKARVVRAEQTVSDLAERAYKYMKKAESRARRELDESGAPGDTASGGVMAPGATPPSSRRVGGPRTAGTWGARTRWGRLRRSDPMLELVPDEATG